MSSGSTSILNSNDDPRPKMYVCQCCCLGSFFEVKCCSEGLESHKTYEHITVLNNFAFQNR